MKGSKDHDLLRAFSYDSCLEKEHYSAMPLEDPGKPAMSKSINLNCGEGT